MEKEYLGDSVYAHYDGYHVILETINGLPGDPSNRIALEPYVISTLLSFIKSLKEKEIK